MNPTLKEWQVFGASDAHDVCCPCCQRYCPLANGPEQALPAPPPVVISVRGTEYLTNRDRHLAVRADLVDTPRDRPIRFDPLPAVDWAAPGQRPGASTALLRAHYVHQLTDCGLTIHAGRSVSSMQPLYRGEQHVGWLMPMLRRTGLDLPKWPGPAMRLADIDKVRVLAADLPVVEYPDPWDTAAALINAIPVMAATIASLPAAHMIGADDEGLGDMRRDGDPAGKHSSGGSGG